MNGPNQNQRRRPPAQQSPSSLLSDQENARLFGMLGKKCISLATGVVQVYLAQGNGMKWQKRCTGVCCFIKDNPKRSYFIRVYSIRNESQLWEQELFNQFKYNAPRPYFHTFDTDQCRAGLNFANEQEAMKFQQVIEDKIRNRQDKRAKSREAASALPNPPRSAVQHQQHHAPPTPSQAPQHTVQMQAPTPSIDKKKSKTKKDKKKGKLSKADIGTPQDFKHVGHVGWDPNKGFDMNNMDPDVKNLFAKAGIKDSDLQDKEKAQFIYKFIEDQGGMEAIKEDIKRVSGPPPAPPTRGGPGGPPPPPRRNDGPPPPPPSRQNAGSPPPPPPQRRQPSSQPPPPPSSRGHRGGPPPPQRSEPPPPPFRGMDSMPPPPPQGGVPPPPPMGSIPPPPPAPTSGSMPPPPPSGGGGGGGRGALLSSIRQGTGLKPPGERAVGGGGGGGGGGGRGALLDQIRLGAALKKPGASDAGSEPAPPAPQEEGLAGALARALQKRETAIQSGSDSDYSGGESDEEWSD